MSGREELRRSLPAVLLVFTVARFWACGADVPGACLQHTHVALPQCDGPGRALPTRLTGCSRSQQGQHGVKLRRANSNEGHCRTHA